MYEVVAHEPHEFSKRLLTDVAYLGGAAVLGMVNAIDSAKNAFDRFIDTRIAAEASGLISAETRDVQLSCIQKTAVQTDGQTGYRVEVKREVPALDIEKITVVEGTLTEPGFRPFIRASRVVTDGLFEHTQSSYNQNRNPRHRNSLSALAVLRTVRQAKRAQKL